MEKIDLEFSDTDLHVHGLALGDLDSDDDLDAFLVLANGDDHQIWINNGSGEFSVQGFVPGPLGHGITLGDLDADGDLDAVSGHGYQSNGNTRIWLNDGSGQFTQLKSALGTDFTAAVVHFSQSHTPGRHSLLFRQKQRALRRHVDVRDMDQFLLKILECQINADGSGILIKEFPHGLNILFFCDFYYLAHCLKTLATRPICFFSI